MTRDRTGQPPPRRAINPESLPQPPGWSQAVAAGGWVFGSGMLATDYAGGIAPDARVDERAPFLAEPLELQSRRILGDIDAVLTEAGADIRQNLVRMWQWMPARYPDDDDYRARRNCWPCHQSGLPYARVLKERVGDPLRSSTGIGVRQLPVPGALLSVDWIAFEPRPGLEKSGVELPADLPQPPIGYSPATRLGDWVFLAGFGATDFRGDWMGTVHMGKPSMIAPEARVNPYIWLGSEITAQTEYTLDVLSRIAEAAGTSLERCVKADIALTHPDDFAAFEAVWRRYFPENPPARNVVTGTQLVIKGLRVEIALLLLAGDSRLEKVALGPPDGLAAVGHAPFAMHAGDFLFTSGLLPVGEGGGVPDGLRRSRTMPYFGLPAADQAEFLFDALERSCHGVGVRLADVCKVQVFLDDMDHLPPLLDRWRRAFPQEPPALSAVATGGPAPLLVPGAHVQLDAIVYAPQR